LGFESSIPVGKEAEVRRVQVVSLPLPKHEPGIPLINEAGAKIAKKTAGDVLVWLGEKVIGAETKSHVLALPKIEGNEKYGRLAPASVFKI
jgi:hypothetical protein